MESETIAIDEGNGMQEGTQQGNVYMNCKHRNDTGSESRNNKIQETYTITRDRVGTCELP